MRSLLKRYLFDGDVLRLMGLTILVKPIGLATQMLIAKYFGAGVQYDAYAFAIFLVTFLDTLVGQTFNTVFLPLAIQSRGKLSRLELLRFQNIAMLIFLVPILVYMAILAFRSGWIVGLIGPNLPAETRDWVDRLLPWMVLPALAMMTVHMFNSVMNLNRKFSIAGAMPLIGGAVVLVTLVLLQRPLGTWALPAGFAASNFIQLLVILLFALSAGCFAWVRPRAPAGGLRQLWSLGWVLMLGQLILTLGMSVERYFATGLEVGSVSSLAYSSNIMNMGTMLFSMSITVVMFTRMSELIAVGDMAACSQYIRDNLNRQSRLVVPASLALCVASGEVVRVLFERGAFGPEDTVRTSGVLAFYMLGLPAMVTNGLVARIYHSLQKLRDRIWLSVQYVGTVLLGNILLVPLLKVQGVAMAATIAINLHLALSFLVLHRYRNGLAVGVFVRILGRAYVLAGAAYAVYALSGFGRLVNGLTIRGTLAGAMLVAFLKAAFIFGAYFAGFLLLRAWERRRRGQA